MPEIAQIEPPAPPTVDSLFLSPRFDGSKTEQLLERGEFESETRVARLRCSARKRSIGQAASQSRAVLEHAKIGPLWAEKGVGNGNT